MSESLLKRLSRWGFVYWSPWFYRTTMSILRPGGRNTMYKILAREIGNQSVLELCCGQGDLTPWLKGNLYVGLDKNPSFVGSMVKKGHNVIQGDVSKTQWPPAQCLVMVDSLYHFIDDIDPLMKKILLHPAETIILSESVQHIALRQERWLVRFIQWGTRVDGQTYPGRFTEESMRALLNRYGFQHIERSGTNLIGILRRKDVV